jgi:hypothetical protein
VFVTGALIICALAAAAAADGAIPVAPSDGAKVSSTPTLAWGPAPGETANQIELSPDRSVQDDGSFVDDPRKRKASLGDTQTSYTVPASEPLLAGTWYWHVELFNFDLAPCCSLWTGVRRIVVQKTPIKLSSFELAFLRPLDELVLRIGYSDNSANLAARYRLVFRERRHGRKLVTIRGRIDKGNFQSGKAFDSLRRPKRLRRGRRYLVQLELRDSAGHVARSRYVHIRL